MASPSSNPTAKSAPRAKPPEGSPRPAFTRSSFDLALELTEKRQQEAGETMGRLTQGLPANPSELASPCMPFYETHRRPNAATGLTQALLDAIANGFQELVPPLLDLGANPLGVGKARWANARDLHADAERTVEISPLALAANLGEVALLKSLAARAQKDQGAKALRGALRGEDSLLFPSQAAIVGQQPAALLALWELGAPFSLPAKSARPWDSAWDSFASSYSCKSVGCLALCAQALQTPTPELFPKGIALAGAPHGSRGLAFLDSMLDDGDNHSIEQRLEDNSFKALLMEAALVGALSAPTPPNRLSPCEKLALALWLPIQGSQEEQRLERMIGELIAYGAGLGGEFNPMRAMKALLDPKAFGHKAAFRNSADLGQQTQFFSQIERMVLTLSAPDSSAPKGRSLRM